MTLETEHAMVQYTQAYLALYRRTPRELRDLGSGWVLVNNAKMSLTELERLTEQLKSELQQEQSRRKGLVGKLLKFFGGQTTA